MKKILSPVLSLALMLCSFSSALAAVSFNLDQIRTSPYVADGIIQVEDRESGTFVSNTFEIPSLAFSFAQESSEYYSYADFDIAVLKAESGLPPLLRLWFTLRTDDRYYDVSSLTIVGHQRQYTFSNLYDEDFLDKVNDTYSQDVLILFDSASMQCLSELMRLRSLMKISADWRDFRLKVIFHGTEDLVAELDENFWQVFDLYLDLYLNSNGSICLGSFEGTPMESAPLP